MTERAPTLGGATRTENCFPAVPGLRQSTGAYLLGLMPPEVLALAKGRVRPLRRDPHYVLPTIGGPGSPYPVVRPGPGGEPSQIERTFSAADVRRRRRLQAELAALREDLALRPGWRSRSPSRTPPSVMYPATPSRRRSSTSFAARWSTTWHGSASRQSCSSPCTSSPTGCPASPPVRTPRAPATTSWSHNMCRLPGADGTWMVAEGGMGAVSGAFAEAAANGRGTAGHRRRGRRSRGFTMVPFRRCRARRRPARSRQRPSWRPAIRGAPRESPVQTRRLSWWSRLERVRRPGTTLKINLALRDLPRLSLPAARRAVTLGVDRAPAARRHRPAAGGRPRDVG